jgi:hypothetical protein
MIHVVVVSEGQTEEAFVGKILAEELGAREVFLTTRLIKTSRTSKGGALKRDRVLRALRNTLRERNDTYVTTFFDLYGLPADFPGVEETRGVADPIGRAQAIERELGAVVVTEAGCRADRFVPYVQPYEFEGLLFSDTDAIAANRPEWQIHAESLRQARAVVASPEHINDGRETHPSARLSGLKPRFVKTRDGPALIQRMTLQRVRAECAHFRAWLERLETLPPLRA